MGGLYARCAGLHANEHVVTACVLTSEPGGEVREQIGEFGTSAAELRRLRRWLQECGVTHAAMEVSGEHWKPVFNVLENACQVILASPRNVPQVPGRKPDEPQCARIAWLLRRGLIQATLLADREVQELRDLCRLRTALLRECVQVGARLRKVLEDANVAIENLTQSASGQPRPSILRALIQGCQDPSELAELARARCSDRRTELERVLGEQLSAHHRFLVRELVRHLEFLRGQVARFEAEIQRRLAPLSAADPGECVAGLQSAAQ